MRLLTLVVCAALAYFWLKKHLTTPQSGSLPPGPRRGRGDDRPLTADDIAFYKKVEAYVGQHPPPGGWGLLFSSKPEDKAVLATWFDQISRQAGWFHPDDIGAAIG